MKTTTTLLWLPLALGLFACAQQSASDTSEADAAAIRSGVDAFVAAWNIGDSATMAPAVGADCVLMQPDGAPLQGRDAIVRMVMENYDINLMQQSATTDDVMVMGDYAYAHGTWKLNPTAAAGADAQGLNGKWSALYERAADGAWEMSRWMWNQAGG